MCKGADSVIAERLSKASKGSDRYLKNQEFVDEVADEGLRTLFLAERELDEATFSAWHKKKKEAMLAVNDREAAVAAVDEEIEQELGAKYWDSLDRMLGHVDFVSTNCPSTPATYHLIGQRRMKLLRQGAYLINASRGQVLDEDALADALEENRLGGAALDVFEREPAVNPRLLEFQNVILLPHMSSATIEGRLGMGEKVLINIRTFLDGHRPPDRVLPTLAEEH